MPKLVVTLLCATLFVAGLLIGMLIFTHEPLPNQASASSGHTPPRWLQGEWKLVSGTNRYGNVRIKFTDDGKFDLHCGDYQYIWTFKYYPFSKTDCGITLDNGGIKLRATISRHLNEPRALVEIVCTTAGLVFEKVK